MDKINIICLSTILLPFLFGIYLIISRLTLSCVNRNVLNLGNSCINLILFIIFTALSISVFVNNLNIEYIINNYKFIGLDFDFGFLLNSKSAVLMVIATLGYSLISIYSKIYFKKKKQFVFTKQRYYCFLAFLAFSTYCFLLSSNLLQALIFWILSTAAVFIFSYFDIFKNSVNFNVTRANRISLIGDFSLVGAILILFKYSILQDLNLNIISIYDNFKELILYSAGFELKLCLFLFLIAASAKLFVFPFSCYLSFFANSSDILYLCVSSIPNLAFGIYVLYLVSPFIKMSPYWFYIVIFFAIAGIISLFSTLFEKNIKIIFGYLISGVNSLFIAGYLFFDKGVDIVYYILSLIITLLFMKLAYIGKINIKPNFLTKKTNFMLERAHIFVFEKFPAKISNVIDIVDRFFVQNIILFFVDFINMFIKFFVIKIKSKSKVKYIRAILLMLALSLIFAIFIALFGSGGYDGELIK